MSGFTELTVNKMLELAGHPYTCFTVQLIVGEDWYHQLTMTTEQHEEWREWFLKNYPHKRTKREKVVQFNLFDLNYGLRISEDAS